MEILDVLEKYPEEWVESFLKKVTGERIEEILKKEDLSLEDYLSLLSPAAKNYLEEMAVRAHKKNLQHFGKTILLYTPLYISNYCVNECVYCGYNKHSDIPRKKLSLEEIDREAKIISDKGIQHILLLSGESPVDTSIEYLEEVVEVLKKYFQSIAIEIYPLKEEGYRRLVQKGVDGVTLYQEVYDRGIYQKLHPKGPKRNYDFRIKALERAIKGGVASVNLGALLGLSDFRKEAFYTGVHSKYLLDTYPSVATSVSFPRMQPYLGGYEDIDPVHDQDFVQILLAYKIFMPMTGITLSTREEPALRENLIPLGITKMSAGVSTAVGGHSSDKENTEQFEISDNRSIEEVKESILKKGYQPILQDWVPL